MEPSSEPSAGTAQYFASGTGLTRRASGQPPHPSRPRQASSPPPRRGTPVIHDDVEPAPRVAKWVQWLSIAAIVALACLQFMPPTHFRLPDDRRRTWIPIGTDPRTFFEERSTESEVVRQIDIFSWTNCLDLRALAVFANSTLSGSSHLDGISFNFLVPEEDDQKLSYFKLKVVWPNSSIAVTGEEEIKEMLNVATPDGNFIWSFRHELAPFVITNAQLSAKKLLYIAADTIIKGRIEDLWATDLGPYAIGATEDCSKRLGDYVNMDILNALQRSGAKSWVSHEPYDKDACLPDFHILVVKPRKLEKTLVEAIMWWAKVLNIQNERDQIRVAAALAFYNNYAKLPSDWRIDDPVGNILSYDGPRTVCSEDGTRHEAPPTGDIWQHYLSQKSISILSH